MKKTRFLSALFAFAMSLTLMVSFSNNSTEHIHAYEENPDTCTHPGLYIETFDYPADCENFAHRDKICSKCGTVVESKRTGSVYGGHVYDYEDIVDYGYKADGCTSYMSSTMATVKCKVCGEQVKVQITSHDYSSSLYHGLEQHMGLDTSEKYYDIGSDLWMYHCSSCNKDVYALIQDNRPYPDNSSTGGDDPINPPIVDPQACVHNYVVTSQKAATCEQSGYIMKKCSKCQDLQTEQLPALGHSYGPYVTTTAANCSTEGVQTSTCANCGKTQTQVIPKSGHVFDTTPTMTFAATCTKEGANLFKCVLCGELKADILPIDPSHHTFNSDWTVVTEGTCNKPTVLVNHCSDCGEEVKKNGEFGNHKWQVSKSQPATCLSDGFEESICYYCGIHQTVTTPSTGHHFEMGANDGSGNFSYKCADCGLSISNSVANNIVSRRISLGAFAITTTDFNLVYKDPASIELLVTKITSEDESYATHLQYLTSMNAGYGTSYAIQDAFKIALYIDGVEYQMNSQMTISWYLDSELADAKTAIIYYPTVNGSTSICPMDKASTKKLVITIPGEEYAKSKDGVILLGINGSPIKTSGDGSADGKQETIKPGTNSGSNNTAIIIIVIVLGVVLLIGGGVAAFFLLGKKKNSDFD